MFAAWRTSTLSNSGGSATAALTVALTLQAGSQGFILSGDTCAGTSLGPGKSSTVEVTYTPASSPETDAATLTAARADPAVTWADEPS